MERYRLNASPHSTHAVIGALVGDAPRVLDVGCNEGYLARVCAPACRFWGVDADAASLSRAAQHYEAVRLVDLEAGTERFFDLSFDAIVFGDVLEHLRDPAVVLKRVVDNHLAAGGRVVISLPNVANWAIRLRLLVGRFDYTETGILDRTHLRLFTWASARRMIRDAGLRIDEERGGSSVFGAVLRVVPVLRGLLASSLVFRASRAQDQQRDHE